MSLISGLATYFIIWWVSLFAILPFGVRTQEEVGEVIPGTAPSAPIRPRMLQKVIATTVLATIVFALYFLALTNGWLALDSLPFSPKFD